MNYNDYNTFIKRKVEMNMRLVVQRVSEASVEIEGKINGQIKQGFMVLVGITNDDNEEIVNKMVNKLINLRIFEDENEKLNLSLMDIKGEILSISQFTLYANCKKGNRPSFIDAGDPDEAERLYEYIIEACKKTIPIVEKGEFGADMKVSLINDGPFTILLDSDTL